MPFQFSGYKGQSYTSKLGVVADGEIFSVDNAAGGTVKSTLSQYSVFTANPIRIGVGLWQVTTLDAVASNPDGYGSVPVLLDLHVYTILAPGTYLGVQILPFSQVAATGQLVISWQFNSAGTPTDLPQTGDPKFGVFLAYSETNI
jgi:hypothetical protein